MNPTNPSLRQPPWQFSQRLYQRLLAAYPRAHREAYGPAMAQLFRDQCRDAWTEGRAWGLATLWCRTLPDLLKTSFLERCATLRPGKYMTNKLTSLFNPGRGPLLTFCLVFSVVFLITFVIAVVVTFILPESYASTARIKVESDMVDNSYTTGGPADHVPSYDPYFIQTTFEVIQSQLVLSNVVTAQNLNVKWGKRYYRGETLKLTETMDILKRRLVLAPVRNTRLITITVYDEDRQEAADLANAVAKAYQDYRLQVREQMALVGQAVLAEQVKASDASIDRLTAETETLRAKFGIPENVDQLRAKYQEQLIDGQRTYDSLQTQLTQLQGLHPQPLRDVLPTVTTDPMLVELLGKLHTTEQALVTITNDYAPDNLHVTRLQSTLNELNRELDARVAGIMIALENEVKSKHTALDSLQAFLDEALQKSKPTPETQPYWDKQRELAGQLEFRKTLAAKIAAAKLDLTIPKTYHLVEVIDSAEPGLAPVKPNKPLNLAIGAVLGILLGTVAGSLAALVTVRLARRLPKPALQS